MPRPVHEPQIGVHRSSTFVTHAEIEEVLLSGGDPLTIVDQKLDANWSRRSRQSLTFDVFAFTRGCRS